ncbi:unnamed protein product [Lymnaea stagnalis]|uniref:NF-X1-type domain-containing protein n=1 Tax=Lymnaea stagnalis TaxID=6523 RepID=A0AAV2IFC5_LYMST
MSFEGFKARHSTVAPSRVERENRGFTDDQRGRLPEERFGERSRGRGGARGAMDHRRGGGFRGSLERRYREDDEGNRNDSGARRSNREGGERMVRPMTYGRLKTWAETADAGQLILFMATERKQVENFLNEERIKEDWCTLFVKAVAHGITAQHQKESIKQVLDVICQSRFLDQHLIMYVTDKEISGSYWQDALKFFTSMVSILKEVLDKLPKYAFKCTMASSHLLNTAIAIDNISQNQTLLDSIKELLIKTKAVRKTEIEKESVKKAGKFMEGGKNDKPPDNFLELSIVPTAHDLKADANPFVRCAVTDGAYDDAQHYLDIQFRLMRQDFIFPLRQGINEFRAAGCKKNFNCSDLRLYFDVHIVGTVFKDGIDHILQFDVSKLASVKWEFSKRLIFGSLLCLSKDNFETVIFATVAHREVGQLAKGNITVNVKSGLDLVFNSTSNDVYVMAETTAYFESYCHVLEGLQEMIDNLPLQDYIIKCKKELKPPKYLLPSGGIMRLPVYNLSCLMLHEDFHEYPVLTTVKWPQPELMRLNRSQREAAMLALTKELAVIQGPPGTGKTYVGLKVMQVLLENKSVMAGNEENADDPILVVCYTNHALDQFLEGILSFCSDGIVRVGGKNKSEKLEKFNIKNLRQRLRVEKKFSDLSVRNSKYECNRELEAVSDKISILNKTMELVETVIQTEDVLKKVMGGDHYESLCDGAPNMESGKQKMRLWLNASNDTPQTVLPGMIKNHLTKLVLKWPEPATAMGLMENMNIVQRANLYQKWLSNIRDLLHQNMAFLTNQGGFSQVHQMNGQMGEITSIMNASYERILSDFEMQMILPEPVFRDINGYIRTGTKRSHAPLGSVVETWLLGLNKSLHDQLDDIQVLTNILAGVDVKEEIFDDAEASKQEQDARIIDDDEDDGGVNYSSKVKAARDNNFVSIIQRAEMLGIQEDIQEEVNEGGWTVKGRRPLSFGRIRNKLISISPMSEEEENDVVDLWTLDLNKKFALYNRWITKYKVSLTEEMEKLVEQYKSAYDRKTEANREETLALLKSAKVIGMTTTGAAKHRAVLQALGCRIIVVEEAAEVLESHIVTALNKKCNHLILIGDHQQLRPNPAVYELATKYGLEISLFERFIKNDVPHVLLQEQHRMRPEISKIMRHIYSKLEDHSSVFKYDHIRGVGKDVFFINHTEKEEKVDDTRSKANIHEAKFLIALYKYLLCQGYEASQITILATYAGQVFAIKKILREQKGEDIGKDFQQVRVTAVDNFQGEENDIILLSLVRSNEQNNVGFLKVDNRVCVALSRAKKGLFVIGNFNVLRTQSKLWEKIIQTADNDKIFGDGLEVVCQNHPNNKQLMLFDTDFDKCPYGGCGQACGYRLECGHVCARLCHGYDVEHKDYKCKKPCAKLCTSGHKCSRLCFQDCGDCIVKVPKIIPICYHEDQVPCHLTPIKAVCSKPCSAVLDCEHQCSGSCGQCRKDAKHKKCLMKIQYCWPCGHVGSIECYLKSSHVECQKVCGSVLGCGHPCKGKCSNCLEGAVHVACEEPCGKSLPCGHKCKGFCGAPCLPCSETCPVECEHGSCNTPNSVKLCSHSCPPCLEPCTHKCLHVDCPKPCSEMCDSEPCSMKCKRKVHICSEKCGGKKKCYLKLQNCNHICAGICGELCVCASCEQIYTISKNNKSDPTKGEAASSTLSDAQDLQLNPKTNTKGLIIKIPSCSHIFYVNELDEYLQNFDAKGSSFLPCPACSKPIMKCKRYDNLNKARSQRREYLKAKLRKQNEITKLDFSKLLMSQRKIEDPQLTGFKYLEVDKVKNESEKEAISFQLKCAFVLGDIFSLEKDMDSLKMLNFRKNAVLKISKRVTQQQKREFTTELLRCLELAYMTQLNTLVTLHDIEIPTNLKSQVKESLDALGVLKPNSDDQERAHFVIVSVRRLVKDHVNAATVQAQCQLMEEAYERSRKVLLSKDEEMLCEIIKTEATVKASYVSARTDAQRSFTLTSAIRTDAQKSLALTSAIKTDASRSLALTSASRTDAQRRLALTSAIARQRSDVAKRVSNDFPLWVDSSSDSD